MAASRKRNHVTIFARVLSVVLILMSAIPAGAADDYPSRPVRIIVGFAAGGAPDALARMIGGPHDAELEPKRDRREPHRRHRQHRHDGGRKGAARRLHARAGAGRQRCREPLAVPGPALRHEAVRADHADRQCRERAGRQRQVAGEIRRRADRARTNPGTPTSPMRRPAPAASRISPPSCSRAPPASA